MVGSDPLCGGDPGGVTQPDSTPGSSSGGHCQDTCDPDHSDCLAGLNCLPRQPGGSDFMCWDQAICTTPIQVEVTNEATEAASCGDGACDPGESSQNCAPDCGAMCGDSQCNGGESQQSCPADCGQPPSASEPTRCPCVNGVLSCDNTKKC